MAAAVFVLHPEHGALCFLCDATALSPNGSVTLTPRDSVRRRVFLEPLGVLIEVEAGGLVDVTLDLGPQQQRDQQQRDRWLHPSADASFTVRLHDDGLTTRYRVRLSTPSLDRPGLKLGVRMLTGGGKLVRGAYEVPLSAQIDELVFGLGTGGLDVTVGNSIAYTAATAARGARNAAPATTAAAMADAGVGCDETDTMALASMSLPDHAHVQMQLVGSPELQGFEGGRAVESVEECARLCAAQRSIDGLYLRCQAWTFALATRARKNGHSWCWMYAGRGNAVGNASACGFVSSTCDNRPGPPSEWPCCQDGFSCPNPLVPPHQPA